MIRDRRSTSEPSTANATRGARRRARCRRAHDGSQARGFIDKRAEGARRAARVRGAARPGARHQEPRARPSRPLSRALRGEGRRQPAARCIGRATPEEARAAILEHLPRGRARKTVTKGKSMISEEIGAQRPPGGATASRRSRPTSANTSSSSAASRPSHIIAPAVHLNTEQVEARFPPRAHASRPASRDLDRDAATLARRRRARVLREKFLAADVGITGANFLIAETGTLDHRHQRGQRRPDADPAAGPHRLASHREDRADAGGRGHHPARAGALGHRAGLLGLHDASPPARAGRAISTGPRNTTSSPRQRPLRRCSAPSSRTCCAASAAAPA